MRCYSPLLLPLLFSLGACTGDEDPEQFPASDAGVEVEAADAAAPDATDWNATFEEVLPDDHVVEIELSFAAGQWLQMLQEWDQQRIKNYYMAGFSHDGDALPLIGVRLKGYSSLLFGTGNPNGDGPIDPGAKWPLKLNFDRFEGERFKLVDRINLGNNVFDASYMRERLGSRMFAAMGVPVARSSYANLSVDSSYHGIYTMVQQIDKRFLKQHFGELDGADAGNLYKCVPNEIGTCTLEWKGADPALYHHSHSCNIGYQECGLVLKTNVEDPAQNDYSDLVHFLDVLNNTPDADFVNAIEAVFDVDSFLRLSAVNVALANFDSYFGRVNNFYLYHRPDTGKFVMIPWDLNMSYGLYGCGQQSMVRFGIQDPACRQSAPNIPLLDRILSDATYHATYLEYVQEVAQEHLSLAKQQQWIDEFDDLLEPLIPQDPNYPHSLQRFKEAQSAERNLNGLFEGYNLMDFVQRRREHILSLF